MIHLSHLNGAKLCLRRSPVRSGFGSSQPQYQLILLLSQRPVSVARSVGKTNHSGRAGSLRIIRTKFEFERKLILLPGNIRKQTVHLIVHRCKISVTNLHRVALSDIGISVGHHGIRPNKFARSRNDLIIAQTITPRENRAIGPYRIAIRLSRRHRYDLFRPLYCLFRPPGHQILRIISDCLFARPILIHMHIRERSFICYPHDLLRLEMGIVSPQGTQMYRIADIQVRRITHRPRDEEVHVLRRTVMIVSADTRFSSRRTITPNSLFLGMIDPLAVGRHMWVTTMRQQNIFPGQRPAKIVCIHIRILSIGSKRSIRSRKNKILETFRGNLCDKLLFRNGTVR